MTVPPGAAVDIAGVEIETADVHELARFYADVLGLPVAREDPGCCAVTVGTTVLRLRQAAPGTEPAYHIAFAVPEDAIEAARDWLAGRGVAPIPVDGDPVVDFPAWNAHAVYFEDPAGNVLELIARHDLPNADPAPFGPHSMLRIDEVGLPTRDVAAVVAELGLRLGALPYGRGSADFQAVGDPRGLAIVVTAGRGWFPTGRPAGLHGTRLTLRGGAAATFPLPGGLATVTVTQA